MALDIDYLFESSVEALRVITFIHDKGLRPALVRIGFG